MGKSRLVEEWEAARDDLGLEIVAPYDLRITGNVAVRAEVLVRNYGARNGMLIVTDYAVIQPWLKPLEALGYGFSTLEEPTGDGREAYDRGTFIEMLSDWGWSGPEAEKPEWIMAPSDEN
jgi:hypothetical protein